VRLLLFSGYGVYRATPKAHTASGAFFSIDRKFDQIPANASRASLLVYMG
jgi:hypothetical protein